MLAAKANNTPVHFRGGRVAVLWDILNSYRTVAGGVGVKAIAETVLPGQLLYHQTAVYYDPNDSIDCEEAQC
jgi:hypothetical protein